MVVSERLYKEQLSDALYYVTLKSLLDDTPINFDHIRVLASAYNPELDAKVETLYAQLDKKDRAIFQTLLVHNENLLARKMATSKAWTRPISEAKLGSVYAGAARHSMAAAAAPAPSRKKKSYT